MALNPNPLQRERVLVQAADTGDRFRAPDTNAALQLAQSLRSIAPEVGEHLDQVAARESEKQRAQAKKDALVGQGQKLADAVRSGKLKPTQNPWYMEAYAKESSAIRAQGSFTQLQLDSTTWAERNDPAAFQKRWAEEVGKLSEGYNGPDELSGFSPIERQFTQQTLQSNTAENVQRIISERKQNVSSLAAQALVGAASRSGGTLSATEAVAALEPSKQMWLATGGTEAEWHELTVKAITSAAYSSQNAGLLDLTKAIGLDGEAVLEGKFGNGTDPTPPAPTPLAPAPQLATASLPAAHRFPVQSFKLTDGYDAPRPYGKHHALDLAAPEGSPVVSPGVGKVVAFDKQGKTDLGKFVRVEYPGGIVSTTGHLSRVDVEPGQQVGAGQALGLVGHTGHATGPHVHWAVKVNGQPVNPKSVAFPQGAKPAGVEQMGGAVAALAAKELNPAAPTPEEAPAVPQGQIARGPSLYDIAGTADSLESDRYRINQAQEDAISSKVRAQQAKIKARGMEATSYLYAQHGTDILLGNYKTPALVQELTGQGFSAQEIGEALGNLRNATGDSAGLSANRMAINGSDPSQAKAVMDLALEGERDGYSASYEQRVGEAVLSGSITGDEGQRMVAGAISRTRQQKAEDRAEQRADRAEAAATPGVIRSYSAAKQQTTALTSLGAQLYRNAMGKPLSDYDRKRLTKYLQDQMGSHLATNPGDFTGAVQKARDFVAGWIGRLQPMLSAPTAGQGPLKSANPRGAN